MSIDLYFDCNSGISGDMTLGAFVDLGVPVVWLKETLTSLLHDGFDITERSLTRHGIAARKVDVTDLEHGADHGHGRNYRDIRTLISQSALPERSRTIALAIFERLARAEAGVHGGDIETVHFHEVGGVDAIVDIAGAALCMEYLDVRHVIASPLALGTGSVECRHGVLPVPAPATVRILEDVPVYGTAVPHELVTPTGAAIITTLASRFGPMPMMTIEKTGYGAGTREIQSLPNLLRVMAGRFAGADDALAEDTVEIVETCIDDMSPEMFGHVMDRLFADGALDVYMMPVYMKKNRPGTLLQTLCAAQQRDAVIARILMETTSIGVRYYKADRRMLARTSITVSTPLGPVTAKRIILPDGGIRITPEYESCRAVAMEKNMPIGKVYKAVEKSAGTKF
ncbi:MAG: nickel pincer cofactor biosynthesis protein LarC [Thermodesulfobacteriota bacterium]|nr:nickel pincer cofactor biosynthesis protein LarC [Thermodesulfobacteriota bacterium]